MTVANATTLIALAATVLTAIRWPHPRAEIAVGSLAAGGVLLSGATPADAAARGVGELAPVLGLLIALLVLGRCCAAAGLFEAIGAKLSSAARSHPRRALPYAAAAAAATTVTLSLDATVVLLTPVVAIAARRLGQRGRSFEFVAVRMANSASLLLPVSNLTNLLAVTAVGVGFLEWAWLMLPVWLCAIVLEYAVVRTAFGTPVPRSTTGRTAPQPTTRGHGKAARTAGLVVALVLAGFVAGSYVGVAPVWPATCGATILATTLWARGRITPRSLAAAAGLPFCYLVACWSVVVTAVAQLDVVTDVTAVLPSASDLPTTVTLALVGMLAANLVNNLPATMLLVPVVAPAGTVALLAVVVGVNVGSNLSYAGSLANLLWRRVVRRLHDSDPTRDFHLLGVVTTPCIVAACATVLWGWTCLVA